MSTDIQIPSDPLLNCPSCGLPTEITDRFTLNGAPSAVEHVKVVCVQRHWYTLPVDKLPAAEPEERSATALRAHRMTAAREASDGRR